MADPRTCFYENGEQVRTSPIDFELLGSRVCSFAATSSCSSDTMDDMLGIRILGQRDTIEDGSYSIYHSFYHGLMIEVLRRSS